MREPYSDGAMKPTIFPSRRTALPAGPISSSVSSLTFAPLKESTASVTAVTTSTPSTVSLPIYRAGMSALYRFEPAPSPSISGAEGSPVTSSK